MSFVLRPGTILRTTLSVGDAAMSVRAGHLGGDRVDFADHAEPVGNALGDVPG